MLGAVLAAICGCVAAADLGDNLAKSVTVYRDRWGVPHVWAKTDAGAAFGLMYAQAEDNFEQIEMDYLAALGRAAEARGRSGLGSDILIRLFETNRRAREHYAKLDANIQAICEGSAAGLNRYLEKHPEVKPRLLTHFEPWYVLAMEHSPASPGGLGITADEMRAAVPELAPPQPPAASREGDEGSNMWAVSAVKSTSGHAMLMINPHVGFFGGGQRYEAHLHSEQGLDISGFAILGTPYIRTGFNRDLGWSHTNNYADTADVYMDPLSGAEEWTEILRVKTANDFEIVKVRLRKTKHGPLVGVRDGRALTVRSQSVEGGALEQRWAMAKARNLGEFKRALSRMGLTGSNTIYADREGNIYYVHGNAMPRRSPKFDWTKPVDGTDPEAEWHGLHALDELPQVENPRSGWVQNCNSTPFLTTSGLGNPERSRYPAYMAPENDTPRSARSRAVLEGPQKFSFDDWSRAALDSKIGIAATRIPEILSAYESLLQANAARAAGLKDMVDELRAWDHVGRVNSVATTLFVRALAHDDKDPLAGLEHVRDTLTKEWGTWRVAWGELNRLQRIHTSGTEQAFSDHRPSVPVAGAPSSTGTIFTFGARPVAGQKRLYGTVGNTYIAVVDFGKQVRAGSLLVFGESADPASAHFFDQAKLYSEQRFKTALLNWKEIRRQAERRYHP